MPEESKVNRELTGFIKAVRAIAKRETRFEHGPATLEFSWTSACNLRCVMCGQSDNPPIVKVSKERAAPFLEKAFESALVWNPSDASEPLLNDVDEILRLCEEKGVFLELFTNATLLTPERFERLAPRIHRLTLSIDSHVPEVLERVRAPIKAAKVFPNVENAFRRCNELQIPCIVNAVLMADTAPHMPAFVDWVADRGGKEITVLDLLDTSSAAKAHDPFRTLGADVVAERLEAMRGRGKERRVNLTFLLPAPHGGRHVYTDVPSRVHEAFVVSWLERLHATESPGFCPMVASYLKVEPNGDAYPCCRKPPELKLGNVFTQPFDEVWNGEVAQSLRASMYTGDVPTPCRGCLVREEPMAEAAARGAFQSPTVAKE